MSGAPYMKLYIGDYLGDTHHLSAIEHGAYLLLLMAMWRAGGKLPGGDDKLCKLARCTPSEWSEIRETVMAFFTRSGGLIRHQRVSRELAKYEATCDGAKRAGKASGLKRANKNNQDSLNVRSKNVERKSNQPEPESDTNSETSVSSLVSVSETSVSDPSPRASPAIRPRSKPVATKRCPPDFRPDATVYRVAVENGLSEQDTAREIATMMDYQFRSGHTDWQAVARNWLRKARPRKANGSPPNLSFAAQDMLIEEEGNRRFIELMEARNNGHPNSGGDRIGSAGAFLALPGKAAGAGR